MIKINKPLLMVLVIVILIPQVAFASWWNPFTWNIFSFFSKKIEVTQTETKNEQSFIPKSNNAQKSSEDLEKDTVNKQVTKSNTNNKQSSVIKSKKDEDFLPVKEINLITQNSPAVLQDQSLQTEEVKVETKILQINKEEMNKPEKTYTESGPEPIIEITKEPAVENIIIEKSEPSYTDLNCPKVTKLEDNQGNISYNRNLLEGTLSASQISTLEVKVTAEDPNGDVLKYRFSPSGFSRKTKSTGWINDNSQSYLGSNLLLGGNRTLFVGVDDGDSYSCLGSNYDVSVRFNYEINP